ncbi:hypothetical protein DPMN_026446 [Dreissena polymorpha]|uniref:Uncharacterized protein n=1 Tax=Dreissena polymorpha TaxID=45954 RepID=A0A9D4LTF0_DREPO|nr:hypothetical protein DPMN_026446 [Dreissena polymorpha]
MHCYTPPMLIEILDAVIEKYSEAVIDVVSRIRGRFEMNLLVNGSECYTTSQHDKE